MKKPRAVLSLLLILVSAHHVASLAAGEEDRRRLTEQAMKSVLQKDAFIIEQSVLEGQGLRMTPHGPFDRNTTDPALMRLSFEQLTKIRLDIWGVSHHQNKKEGKSYNERNWGYGGKYYYDDQNFAMGGYLRNTQTEATWFMGHGVRRAVLEISGVKAYVGVVAGLVSYGTEKKTLRLPMLAPGIEIEGKGMALNFALLPGGVFTGHVSILKPF